jgi:hypothetical protein
MVIFDIGLSALAKRFPALLDSQIANIFKNMGFFIVITCVFLGAYLAARKSEISENFDPDQPERFNLQYTDSFRIGSASHIHWHFLSRIQLGL